MELRLADRAGRADPGDRLPALDALAALHRDALAMRVSGGPAVGMLEQDEIAEAAQLVSGIGDDAVAGRQHRRAERRRDVDAVVLRAVRPWTITDEHRPADRPREAMATLRWLSWRGRRRRRGRRRQ